MCSNVSNMTTVVAGILRRDARVLVCRRPEGKQHPLKWEFPGGKVEPGEAPAAALSRELREELDIDAVIGREIDRYEYAYPGRPPIVLVFFEVEEFSGDPRNLAFHEIRWEAPARLAAYDFLEGDTAFLRRFT